MTNVTQILSQIGQGDPTAAEQLLPLVYQELRKLAAAKMAQEKAGQTLQATALVHEAYLRLVDVEQVQKWDSRGHFFAAAAEAMRRILVDRARRRIAEKRGGRLHRVALSDCDAITRSSPEEVVALDDALALLAKDEPEAVELVKLRIFAGCSVEQAGAWLGISRANAYRHWTYARAWLKRAMSHHEPSDTPRNNFRKS